MPMMDIKLGFHQIAKFNYFPGWHQQVSCGELLMNKKAWDALPEAYKAMIETAGEAQIASPTPRPRPCSSTPWPRCATSTRCRSSAGTTRTLAAFEKAWLEVLQEESAKDPLFKKVADHYLDFRKKYADLGQGPGHEGELPRQVARSRGRRGREAAPAFVGWRDTPQESSSYGFQTTSSLTA